MRIFLSRPTWISSEYQPGIETFVTQLRNLGLDPRTLGVSDYPSKTPLDEVIEIMEMCRGAIVLGVPQLEIHSGLLKTQQLAKPLTLGTEWNHLEAGLAYAAGLPLLVIHHHTVTRGIFDRGVLNAFLHSVDLASVSWSMAPGLNGAIVQWKENCVQGIGNRPLAKPVAIKDGKPVCPNCSSTQKSIYMRPIPPPFSELAGGSWECASCGYVE